MNVMVCKKQKSEKDKTGHKQDFYPTPTSLVKELLKTGVLDKSKVILDPACGQHAIDDTLRDTGLFRKVIGTDIIYGDDFLTKKYKPNYCDTIVMNPPFELFDEFVVKAKDVAPLVVSIGKTDLFSAYKRYYNGLWKNLKEVYIFDRKVDYSNIERKETFKCGMMTTGWFVWDKNWDRPYWKTSIIDVQKYVETGAFSSTETFVPVLEQDGEYGEKLF